MYAIFDGEVLELKDPGQDAVKSLNLDFETLLETSAKTLCIIERNKIKWLCPDGGGNTPIGFGNLG